MKKLPWILIYSRVPIAILIAAWAILPWPYGPIAIPSLMILGLLTDVFDGIIARQLGVSSEKMRIADSSVDQFFWLLIIAALFYANWIFIKSVWPWIAAILILEILAYLFSYLKFKKPIATHSILAKIWTISLLAFLIDLSITGQSSYLFYSCVILGLISRLEILGIIILLKKWTTDVPSILNVKDLNAGKAIKRNKLFNG